MRRRVPGVTVTLLFVAAVLVVAAAGGCAPGGAARPEPAAPARPEAPSSAAAQMSLARTPDATPVGSERCAPCHATAHAEWSGTPHARGFRAASIEDEDRLSSLVPCSDMSVTHVLGERHHVRYLIENADAAWGSGRFLALPCGWDVHGKQLQMHHAEDWRARPIESSCLPCHVTAQGADWSFAERGVGCESCHGNGSTHVALPVASNILSFRTLSPLDEVTVCASCHLQGGKSARTGRSFPDGYTPGDALFDDYQFDWDSLDSANAVEALDVHQKLLIRSLALGGARGPEESGGASLRCTSCHALHGMGHEQHAALPREAYCLTCHEADTYQLKEYRQSCPVCEF